MELVAEAINRPAAKQKHRRMGGLTVLAAWSLLAIAAFHVSMAWPPLAFLMLVFLYALTRLSEAPLARLAFYPALLVGVACYGPHLAFFWGIFHVVAISFWTILALWPAFFVLAAYGLRQLRRRFPRVRPLAVAMLLPILWTGQEYFRSELNYLRFSWLSPGFAFGDSHFLHLAGVYGIGFLLMAAVAVLMLLHRKAALVAGAGFLMLFAVLANVHGPAPVDSPAAPFFAGVQVEDGTEKEIIKALDQAITTYPQADMFLLSEYAFTTPPPPALKSWCRRHERYVLAGGMEPVKALSPNAATFENTAYVIGPSGEIVFSQGKCVPIQFFSDGQAAREQHLWQSPWGKIGICICYDLSYTRVTDELIRQGAQALIVPTMDAESWGSREHALHARVAPLRAAEYGVPVIRIASSGVSQFVDAGGIVRQTAPFPGQGAMLAGRVTLGPPGHLPLDRRLGILCAVISAFIAAGLSGWWIKEKFSPPPIIGGSSI